MGAILAIIMMPAGFVLDYFVYPHKVWSFLQARLFCSLLVGVVLALFFTSFGKKHYRVLGMTWYMLPALFIAWMIYAAKDPLSPYYAGLNLVVLAIGLILPWTYQENLLAAGMVIFMYVAAGLLQSSTFEARYLVNNVYFLSLTSVVVVVSSYFHSKLRFREFSLRHELDANRQQLEEGNRKLVELDRVKSRFFANMSHELRTPLTLLIAPLETILHRKAPEFDAETGSLLQTMHANGMRLLKLINDLLDLEKLESEKMHLRKDALSVRDFIRGLANSVQGVAKDKRLKVTTLISENIGTIVTDRDKLEKILLNLMFNALKFTAGGGEVTVQAERRNETLILRVADTGMGIAENHLPFIFDRFWQADTSAQRKYQGTGIGLALVKELVEVQGGKVIAESQLGKGTTMTIELPYIEAKAELEAVPEASVAVTEAGPVSKTDEWLSNLYRRAELHPGMASVQEGLRPEEVSATKKPRMLIADDEPDMLRFLKTQLSGQFHVLEAVDGLQATEKASQFLPEIILLDMMMPEKDGLQVCRELRAKTSTQHIPIILLTARADEETKLATLSAGANDFLSKPFSTTELHVRVKNLVEQHQMQRTLARQNQILEATLEELKDAQAQLVHSEKMAGLGRMSAGIIHEINNPLNYTKTALYSLRKKEKLLPAGEQPDFGEVLRDIEEGVDRVKNIVSDLRTFTHPSTDQLESVDVKKVVASVERFLSDQLKAVRFEKAIPEDFRINGNSNKLVQVLVNLVQNALDALKEKQFLDSAPTIWMEAKSEPGRRLIIIRDNGNGIPSENLGKIFDPFFTTKDVGEGMGLGLSICYRILTEWGGTVSVSSEVGSFTEFKLEFPEK
ncbi:MAG: integral rane sensor hybrid histidine kinase [Verrucomicrobiales bacterium]|nr:integral rane sensor hybrid histidine kinase [Verrucomicrobiales bacterium]